MMYALKLIIIVIANIDMCMYEALKAVVGPLTIMRTTESRSILRINYFNRVYITGKRGKIKYTYR